MVLVDPDSSGAVGTVVMVMVDSDRSRAVGTVVTVMVDPDSSGAVEMLVLVLATTSCLLLPSDLPASCRHSCAKIRTETILIPHPQA